VCAFITVMSGPTGGLGRPRAGLGRPKESEAGHGGAKGEGEGEGAGALEGGARYVAGTGQQRPGAGGG
jgi:hypothetical protein